MKPAKRTRKLVLSSMQLRLIGAFAGAAAATSLLQIYLINRTLREIGELLPPDSEALAREIPGILGWNVALAVGVLTPVMILVGLFVTHRVAGPAMKMERYLRALAAGTPEEGPCQVRETDELKGLCEAINLAIEHAREQRGRTSSDAAGPGADERAA